MGAAWTDDHSRASTCSACHAFVLHLYSRHKSGAIWFVSCRNHNCFLARTLPRWTECDNQGLLRCIGEDAVHILTMHSQAPHRPADLANSRFYAMPSLDFRVDFSLVRFFNPTFRGRQRNAG